MKTVRKYTELITSHQAICAGFLVQAKAKVLRASPFVKEAHELWNSLQKARNVSEVANVVPITSLTTAMGFSEKAQNHFKKNELKDILTNVLETTISKDNPLFREEILYRYLLTRGDTLGGMMRNVTGASAQILFTGAVVTTLNIMKKPCKVITSPKSKEKIKAIRWDHRLMVFDRKPKVMDKNVDVILLDCSMIKCSMDTIDNSHINKLLENTKAYIACGELKGGIDPAGADEHWKTARSALHRIREKFKSQCPHLFFAANAIEEAMAKEIFQMLENGELSACANLNFKEQIEELTFWLVSL